MLPSWTGVVLICYVAQVCQVSKKAVLTAHMLTPVWLFFQVHDPVHQSVHMILPISALT